MHIKSLNIPGINTPMRQVFSQVTHYQKCIVLWQSPHPTPSLVKKKESHWQDFPTILVKGMIFWTLCNELHNCSNW